MKVHDIFESPQIIDPTDFDLSDELVNKKLLSDFLHKKKEIIVDDRDFEVFKTGDGYNGYIVLHDKIENSINYLVRYRGSSNRILGKKVTQILLWRGVGKQFVPGITKTIFYDYLLREYDSVVSDREQTEDGKKFWLDRMVQGLSLGYNVGLIKNNVEFIWFNPATDRWNEWIKNNHGWDKENKFYYMVYVVSNLDPFQSKKK